MQTPFTHSPPTLWHGDAHRTSEVIGGNGRVISSGTLGGSILSSAPSIWANVGTPITTRRNHSDANLATSFGCLNGCDRPLLLSDEGAARADCPAALPVPIVVRIDRGYTG
eukprot:6305807-Pyramimonas_sp.AAC.1